MRAAATLMMVAMALPADAPRTPFWIRMTQRSASIKPPMMVVSCMLIGHDGRFRMQRQVDVFPGSRKLQYHSGELTSDEQIRLTAFVSEERVKQLKLEETRLDKVKILEQLDQSTIYISRGDWDQEIVFANVDGQMSEPDDLKPLRAFLKSIALRRLAEDKELGKQKLDICKEASRRGPEQGRPRLTP